SPLLTRAEVMWHFVSTNKSASGCPFLCHFRRLLLCFLAMLFGSTAQLAAQTATLAWNRNSETNLSNYTLKYGTASGSYTSQLNVPTNQVTVTVSNLTQNRTYYFVVTARNQAGMESDPSNEVNYYVPRTTNTAPVAGAAAVTTAEDTAKSITLTGS